MRMVMHIPFLFVNLASFSQNENASSSIRMTILGMTISASSKQLLNAVLPICATPSGMTTLESFLQ